ncbi:hypothetical protein Poli38472_001830 [Pythium oligandrum]|uniref:t-SNARE coiled-coil homology domain-containing protein n=1 Tax=Pythium oligandrum TaxID=41045 RepID=A0A8K1FQQ6_PYTOL|nr:hypothetical protein Poli38472_001830 [Pythium oligandrum]|eukprot:TMW69674.1 hypothetical protein Poli38472_001830 [Pythium oligandrum]
MATRENSPSADYDEVSTPRLQERIEKDTREQDRQLDAIYQGAKRLHGAAIATNEEVVHQNHMIDEISVQISDTQQAVQEQTTVARRVKKKHRELCAYYIVILIEFAALIVIIVI